MTAVAVTAGAHSFEDLEAAIDRLISALQTERHRSRELAIQMADLEARLARSPAALVSLEEENRCLRRNAAVAAAKVQDLLERL